MRANELAEAQGDSMVRARAELLLERMAAAGRETVTDIVVYDTGKPATDSTGRPPVKASLHRESRTRRQSRETAGGGMQSETRATAETRGERTVETDSLSSSERKPGAGAGMLRTGAGIFLTAAAIVGILAYYRRTRH